MKFQNPTALPAPQVGLVPRADLEPDVMESAQAGKQKGLLVDWLLGKETDEAGSEEDADEDGSGRGGDRGGDRHRHRHSGDEGQWEGTEERPRCFCMILSATPMCACLWCMCVNLSDGAGMFA